MQSQIISHRYSRAAFRVGALGCLIAMFSACLSSPASDQIETEVVQMKDSVKLTAGLIHLEVAPAFGGSITALEFDGMDVMRPTPQGADDIVEVSSFPLVPIVNRIPDGRFEFEGTNVDLEGNFMGLPDFIHGYGWRGAWDVVAQSDTTLTIRYQHEACEWPWRFSSEQHFELTPSGLKVELSVKNESSKRMPAALGFHPYFPTTPETRLTASYDGHWVNNELGHVIRRVPGSYRKDFRAGADMIDDVMTDQTHYGWTGAAVLTEPGRPTTKITASENISNLHVFFPPNGDFVAIEPTAGRGDPFGTDPVEYVVLEPGERFSVWMKVEVE